MSKKKTIEIIRNAKIQKNEYFVENYDVTESVECLLAEVERDYEFKKQVELQCGLCVGNDILNKQAEKYKKQIGDLEAKLTESEEQTKRRIAVYEKQFVEQTDGIYKLKQQLAEKESELCNTQSVCTSAKRDSAIYFKENIELRKQLTESEIGSKESEIFYKREINRRDTKLRNIKQELAKKDKKIAYLTKQVKKFNNEAQKYFEDAYCNDTIYQDKTSFCIEQLEKVKDLIFDLDVGDNYKGMYSDIKVKRLDVYEVIDNQIKRLKEGQ